MDIEDLVAEGQRLLSQMKFEEAAASFDAAVAADPGNPVLYASRGAALIALGRHDEAFADFDRAVALAPDNPRLYYRRGMGRMAQMNFEAAVADFTKAIDLDHQYAVAFYSRGMAYDSLGREEESREDLRRSWVLGQAKLQGELDSYGIIRTEMDRPR